MANQNFNTFGRGGVIADQATFDAGLRTHMIRVYNYMASGLALSGIVAVALFNVPSLAALFFEVTPRGVAGLINMFFPSGTMSFIISAAGVLIFSGLIAYDTQKIKEQYADAWGSQTAEKVAIFGALSLYLDFVNLFQFLMAFMGQERD